MSATTDALAAREGEKRRRSRHELALSGPGVFEHRRELADAGCLFVPGLDKCGVRWVPGGTGRDLVALAPDDAARRSLKRLLADADGGAGDESSGGVVSGAVVDGELVEARRRFAVNDNYLRAWASSAGFAPGRDDADVLRGLLDAVAAVASERGFAEPVTGTPAVEWLRRTKSGGGEAGDVNEGKWLRALRNALYSAWGAELMIALQREYMPGEQLARVANNWSVVQAYYALHHLVQALRVASGGAVSDSHAAARSAFRKQWTLAENPGVSTDDLLDSPLRAWLSSHRGSRDAPYSYHLGRDEVALGPQTVSHLAPLDPLDATYVLSACLRSTHEQAVTDKSAGERARHREVYTVIDYLYRFRCKRNYEDNVSLLRGAAGPGDALAMQDNFVNVSAASAVLHEHRVINGTNPATGEPLRDTVLGWMSEWLDAATTGVNASFPAPLRTRLELHQVNGVQLRTH